jgi:hypothetical protein
VRQLFFNVIDDFALFKNPQRFEFVRRQFMHADVVRHRVCDTRHRSNWNRLIVTRSSHLFLALEAIPAWPRIKPPFPRFISTG